MSLFKSGLFERAYHTACDGEFKRVSPAKLGPRHLECGTSVPLFLVAEPPLLFLACHANPENQERRLRRKPRRY